MTEEAGRATRSKQRAPGHQSARKHDQRLAHNTPPAYARRSRAPLGSILSLAACLFAGGYLLVHIAAALLGWQACAVLLATALCCLPLLRLARAARA